MPPSKEFNAGLIIGALASFLGSLAAGFLITFITSKPTDYLYFGLAVVCFGALMLALYPLYKSLTSQPPTN